MPRTLYAIGLMSGTSLDGIDASLIRTDGHQIYEIMGNYSIAYSEDFRAELKNLLTGQGDILASEQQLTILHAYAVKELLNTTSFKAEQIDIIGFHGQTICHRPDEGITQQIGDGSLLAELTKINVISDFRRRDMAAGGQGAPLIPLYHTALANDLPKPIVIVNIGGVSNVTWIGESELDLIAFDSGPGNAPLNDLVWQYLNQPFDASGQFAASGTLNTNILEQWFGDQFFQEPVPKSLDRNHFHFPGLATLPAKDGACTLTHFIAATIAKSIDYYPVVPKKWLITGGGRHNTFLMSLLEHYIGQELVENIDKYQLNGDFIEAQGFAFLAVRSLYGLHLSLPGTTGCHRPVTGGAFYRA